LCLALCAVLAGCSTYNRQGPPKFDVELSFMDYATFTYHTANESSGDDHPVLVRIELSGGRHMQYAKGRSRRVLDAFWSDDVDDQHVEDIYTDQIILSEKQMEQVFQALVNAGIFEREMQGKHIEDPLNDSVFIHAKISDRRGIVYTDSREFIGIYKKLERHFSR